MKRIIFLVIISLMYYTQFINAQKWSYFNVKEQPLTSVLKPEMKIGVAKFKNIHVLGGMPHMKVGNSKYWREEDIPGIGKTGKVKLDHEFVKIVGHENVTNLIQAEFIEMLKGQNIYEIHYGTLLPKGKISNTSEEGEQIKGYQNIVAIEEQIRPDGRKFTPETITDLGGKYEVDVIVFGTYELGSSIVEVLESITFKTGNFYLRLGSFYLHWEIYDAKTGEKSASVSDIKSPYRFIDLTHSMSSLDVHNNNIKEIDNIDSQTVISNNLTPLVKNKITQQFSHYLLPYYHEYKEKKKKKKKRSKL